MKIVLVSVASSLALVVSSPCRAQSPDVARFAKAAVAARQILKADKGRLWGARLDGVDWMGVERGQVYLSSDPRTSGYAKVGSMWEGPLPAGIAPSNTSVTWNGKRWAMIMLPIPVDSVGLVRVLIHEAMHVLQPDVLPTPKYSETGAGSDLLDEAGGRTWLTMEWRALAAALRTRGKARDAAVHDALTFRAVRYMDAAPQEVVRERALDVTEGLPEYTALELTGATDLNVATVVDGAPASYESYVRAFPYATGPAYGFLLDRYTGASWRRVVKSVPDLQRETMAAWSEHSGNDFMSDPVTRVLSGHSPSASDRASIERLARDAGARYGREVVRSGEEVRWARRQTMMNDARAKFIDGPTLRLRPRTLAISFDPRSQLSLGAVGTVMANVSWKSQDGGSLAAPGGAFITPTWNELRLPLGDVTITSGTLVSPIDLSGTGWTLHLPSGWTLSAEGSSWVATPPRP